jgi:hypothetical protein
LQGASDSARPTFSWLMFGRFLAQAESEGLAFHEFVVS